MVLYIYMYVLCDSTLLYFYLKTYPVRLKLLESTVNMQNNLSFLKDVQRVYRLYVYVL